MMLMIKRIIIFVAALMNCVSFFFAFLAGFHLHTRTGLGLSVIEADAAAIKTLPSGQSCACDFINIYL
jgi:hypothetical protein